MLSVNPTALRVSAGVTLAWCVSELTDPRGIDEKSLEWCAFTVVVVSAPTLGFVVVKGLDRVVGTVLGGVVSLVVCLAQPGFFGLMGLTCVAAVASVVAADRFKKDYSAKLFFLTFLLIAIGAASKEIKDVVAFAMTRMKGIVEGGIMVAFLSAVMWPEAASTSCLTEIRNALQMLQRLQEDVWENGATSTGWSQLAANKEFKLRVLEDHFGTEVTPSGPPDARSSETGGAEGSTGLDTKARSLRRLHTLAPGEFAGKGQLPLNTSQDLEVMEMRQEQTIDHLGGCLARADSLAKQSKAEIFAGTLRGWPVFLPGLEFSWARLGWALPSKEIAALSKTIRKAVRLSWSMQRAFQEGFDDELMKVVADRYPPDMLSSVQNGSIAVLREILETLPEPGQLQPRASKVQLVQLVKFCTDVQRFLSIGAEQRRGVDKIIHDVKHEPARTSRPSLQVLKPVHLHTDAHLQHPSSTPEQSGQSGSGVNPGVERALLSTMALPRNQSEQGVLQMLQASDQEKPARAAISEGSNCAVMFPNTPCGHIAKVRWYSFLFLVERLAIALVELVEDVDDLLCKLPGWKDDTPVPSDVE